ncbi:TPA: hypothetical protein L6676_004596 [Escherichia coli]|nr:hypothetical protein [Escherichia coli]
MKAPSGAFLLGIYSMDTHILRQHHEKNHSFF